MARWAGTPARAGGATSLARAFRARIHHARSVLRLGGSWLALIGVLIGVMLLNIGLGAVRLDPHTIVSVIAYQTGDLVAGLPGVEVMLDRVRVPGAISGLGDRLLVDTDLRETSVVWYIRLPRTLLATFIGAGLGIAGASLQGVFRNPLADPGIIGVSSGAAVGAVAAIVLGVAWLGVWTLPLFAFVAALAVTTIVYGVARRGGRTEVVTLILAGVAISSLAGGMVGWLTTIATDAQLRSISFWQLGSLAGAQWPQVGVVAAVVTAGGLVLWRLANALNLLTLGEREARHLGVHVERTRGVAMFTTAAMTGAAVSFAGAIGFVGLVVPHLVRLMSGPDHRLLLPRSAVLGAIVLMLADLTARLVVAPMELPVGVVMGLIGGPFFAWLLLQARKEQGGWA